MEQSVENIRRSLGRALTSHNLIRRFYDIFMVCDPRIAEKFSNTDFDQQYALLEHALSMAILFPQGNFMAKQAMARLRQSHNARHLDIPPELYTLWADSLIKALADTDPEFSDTLEQQWRETLQPAIDYIQSGYNE